jgi:hypothetical protein
MREYQSHPNGTPIQTKYGTVHVTAVGCNQVYCDANSNGKELTVHGVKYGACAHFEVQADGSLKIRERLYATRSLSDPNYSKGASQSAKDVLVSVLEGAGKIFISENPSAVEQANRRYVNNRIASWEGDRNKLKEQLNALQLKIEAAERIEIEANLLGKPCILPEEEEK